MAPGYEFREGLLPLSLLTIRRTPRIDEIDGIMGHYRALVERRIRYASVIDVRAAREVPDALARRRFGEETARFEPFSREWSLGNCIVVNSEVLRGALIAIQWVARPQQPLVYFSELRPAVDWAARRLEAAGLPLTPAIVDFREHAR